MAPARGEGRGRAVQQIGERRADRLPGVALVVEKARAGIDLEAKELALGRLLQVDPGEEEVERLREPQARRFHCPRQGDRPRAWR